MYAASISGKILDTIFTCKRDVAIAVGLSVKTLDRHFSKHSHYDKGNIQVVSVSIRRQKKGSQSRFKKRSDEFMNL